MKPYSKNLWHTYKTSPYKMSPRQNVSQQNVSLTKRLRNNMSPCNKTSPNKKSPRQNVSGSAHTVHIPHFNLRWIRRIPKTHSRKARKVRFESLHWEARKFTLWTDTAYSVAHKITLCSAQVA
jgi:hypothetical protein